MRIRETRANDHAALDALYPAAFPEEDLLPLLHDLLAQDEGTISLVAETDEGLVGHIAFTLGCAGEGRDIVALLGPLCVIPHRQRQGIGAALIQSGQASCLAAGAGLICVLGDPAYYGRQGFTKEIDVTPPYPLPEAWLGAWQSMALTEGQSRPRGSLELPQLWHKPEYWRA